MTIAIIVAMTKAGIIGDKGKIPWHIREDLQRFKRLTMGHPIIMGRRTYESIGKPLPGRTNIVLTRSATFAAPPEVLRFGSLDAALDHCRKEFGDLRSGNVRGQETGAQRETVFIIGGSKVYEAALPLADKLFVTEVRQNVPGDTKFPAYDRKQWSETAREDGAECSFVEYFRAISPSG
ncbi:MAG TPA: dihydrofolate reductase [Verrucomicrobiae bacterium]|nr:dihydrofolate reductase [Verrucomicrobiae bacterium]